MPKGEAFTHGASVGNSQGAPRSWQSGWQSARPVTLYDFLPGPVQE